MTAAIAAAATRIAAFTATVALRAGVAAFFAFLVAAELADALANANAVAVLVRDALHELRAKAVRLRRFEAFLRRWRILAALEQWRNAADFGGYWRGEKRNNQHQRGE